MWSDVKCVNLAVVFQDAQITGGTRQKKSLIVEQFQGNYLNVEANRVRAVTACHAFRSRAGLQGFRSEIEYLIFDQV